MPPRVRARTLAHLDTLLAMSALAAACTANDPGYGVVDPMPIPAQGDPPDPQPVTIPEASGTTPPPVPVPPPELGYGVVDPMPAPAYSTCRVFADAIYATASVLDASVAVVINVNALFQHHAELDPNATPTATHATLSEVQLASGAWNFRVSPDGSVHTVSVGIKGTCEGAPATAKLRLNWEGELTNETVVSAVVVRDGK